MPGSRSKTSLRWQVAVITVVPLLVFFALLLLAAQSIYSRINDLYSWAGLLEVTDQVDPLRLAINREYDGMLLGDESLFVMADGRTFEQVVDRVIRHTREINPRRFAAYREDILHHANRAKQLRVQAREEWQAQGTLSRLTRDTLDQALEDILTSMWRSNVSYQIDGLPISNGKYMYNIAYQINTALDFNRRRVVLLLSGPGVGHEDAMALLNNFHFLEKRTRYLSAAVDALEFPPAARMSQDFSRAVTAYLDQPLLRWLREAHLPALLRNDPAPAYPAGTLPEPRDWYERQSPHWQRMVEVLAAGTAAGTEITQRILLWEMAQYLLLVIALFGALVFTLVHVRRFGKQLLHNVDVIEGTLTEISDSGKLAGRVDVQGSDEIRRISEAVNQLLTRLQKNDRRVRNLLAISRANEEQMAEQAREIEQRADEAEAANRHKSEFLSNMSHELRTPLNSILLLSAELNGNRKGHLDGEEVECAKVVHDAGQTLLTLINDILDLSKVEAGKMVLVPERVDLDVLTDVLRKRYRPMAEAKGLRLDFAINATDLPPLFADRLRLEQIVTNLLSNALKFTREGGVQVQFANTVEDGSRESLLEIRVTDTGIGIAPRELERVFNLFEQADGSTTREFGGTGLGLALSRSLAELMGGSLTADSTPGSGSTFTLRLPFGEPMECAVTQEAESLPEDPPPSEAASFNGETVLIVDDNPRNLFSLHRALQQVGLAVMEATDADQCMASLRQHRGRIRAVCLDIMMPGRNGFDVLREIRETPGLQDVPVIALTAQSMKGDREKCLEAGADYYLSKPIDLPQLFGMLQDGFSETAASRKEPGPGPT